MDNDERALEAPTSQSVKAADDRWRILSEHIAAKADRAFAEREAAVARLRDLHARYSEIQLAAWFAERDRLQAEVLLIHAKDHISRTQPLLRAMRAMLELLQNSKFWKARNAWFQLKQGLGIDPTGEVPHWLPDVDDLDDRWMRELPYERWMLGHKFRDSDRRRLRSIIGALRSAAKIQRDYAGL